MQLPHARLRYNTSYASKRKGDTLNAQQRFTCSKLTIENLKNGIKYVQSSQ